MDGPPKSHASDMRAKPLKTIPVVPRRSSLPLQPLALHQTKSHSFFVPRSLLRMCSEIWTGLLSSFLGLSEWAINPFLGLSEWGINPFLGLSEWAINPFLGLSEWAINPFLGLSEWAISVSRSQ
ncbi:hypothetical protein RRG08_020640 [Elysia crispata]|uniref:Uncharacterized protein n=1 Tax=Elysia crispata TaxID=231223 RepID=A0AAE0YKA5_9GAST|nr:hypothetical protein RRG08_020640 [Elysia crispata]